MTPTDLYSGPVTPDDLCNGPVTPTDLYSGPVTPTDLYSGPESESIWWTAQMEQRPSRPVWETTGPRLRSTWSPHRYTVTRSPVIHGLPEVSCHTRVTRGQL